MEAGIVEKPEHYLYSSAKDYFYTKKCVLLGVVGFGVFINNNIFSNELQTHYNNPKVLILLKGWKTKENRVKASN